MSITIAERLKPFSHKPGVRFVIPGTQFSAQIFPALIRIYDLTNKNPTIVQEVPVQVRGPVNDFTAQQDLEKGIIKVWGHTLDGYMRYTISAGTEARISIAIEKHPHPNHKLIADEYCTATSEGPKITERLSLGKSKAQDWTLMHRRQDMSEIFPLWMHLGNITPTQQSLNSQTPSLLNECRQAISDLRRMEILPAFQNLYLAAFDDGLSPRLNDTVFQGFSLPVASEEASSSLQILTEGAKLIKSLFLQSNQQTIHILPVLPPEFHCGRLLQITCGTTGICDIEWSKKIIRRVIFTAIEEASVHFCFQNDVKRFRLRQNAVERGTVVPCGSTIEVKKGQQYFFDHFEK